MPLFTHINYLPDIFLNVTFLCQHFYVSWIVIVDRICLFISKGIPFHAYRYIAWFFAQKLKAKKDTFFMIETGSCQKHDDKKERKRATLTIEECSQPAKPTNVVGRGRYFKNWKRNMPFLDSKKKTIWDELLVGSIGIPKVWAGSQQQVFKKRASHKLSIKNCGNYNGTLH